MSISEPTREQVLEFCSREPVERVFLEDVARRGLGRFAAVERARRHASRRCATSATNLVPSGEACGVYRKAAAGSKARMIIGEAVAVGELWDAARDVLPAAREDRPGPAGLRDLGAAAAGRAAACGPRGRPTSTCSCPPAPPRTRSSSASIRWRATTTGFAGGRRPRSTRGARGLWIEDGVVLFKAEASAWTPSAVQLQQVWVDPAARGRGYASRGPARPDPAAARADADGDAVRPPRERAGDPALRVGRDAARPRLPERPVLERHCSLWTSWSPSASRRTSAGTS